MFYYTQTKYVPRALNIIKSYSKQRKGYIIMQERKIKIKSHQMRAVMSHKIVLYRALNFTMKNK